MIKNKSLQFEPKLLLKQYKQKVDKTLEEYFKRKIKEYKIISPFVGKFTEDLAEFTLRGGKRFRPALIFYSYKLFGGKDDKEILKLSIFIELIQSFLLIHDDIMDRASLRRGGRTIHKTYEKYSKDSKFNDDSHFGSTMGILSGDLANQLALEIIGESNFPYKNINELIKLVSREISKVCFGQIHDILLNYNYPKLYTEADILKVHFYKTATYTYRLPLLAGAILAGATNSQIKILERYAMFSGIAFQIRDDVLGVFGDKEETGKENVSDIVEGKKTLLVTKAYENANRKDSALLKKYLGKKDLTIKEANIVREIFRKTGSLDYSIKECEKYIHKAKLALSKIDNKENEAYKFLDGIADYMLIRNV